MMKIPSKKQANGYRVIRGYNAGEKMPEAESTRKKGLGKSETIQGIARRIRESEQMSRIMGMDAKERSERANWKSRLLVGIVATGAAIGTVAYTAERDGPAMDPEVQGTAEFLQGAELERRAHELGSVSLSDAQVDLLSE